MTDYDIEIDDKEIAYLQNCDFSNLLNDCENLVNLIDSLNIDDEDVVFD